MAVESVREEIIANIKTTLEAIDGDDPYWTDVARVSRVMMLPTDLRQEKLPGLLVIASGEQESITQEHGHRSLHTMPIGIVGVIERQPSDVGTALNRFMKDVTAAMAVDVTRGGNASMTWKVSQMDASNMFSNISVFEMDYNIRYHTNSREE